MKKATLVLALLVISFPFVSYAMTANDVEQQLSIYKNQLPSVLGVASSSVSGSVKPISLQTSSVSTKKGNSSTEDVPTLQLSPEQVKVIMQGLKYTDPKGSSVILSSTIKPGQSDDVNKNQDSVKKLQLFLNATGCDLATTGKYGAQTKKCVMYFQKKKGLTPDGVVGPNFRKEMAKEIDSVTTRTTPTQ